MGQLTSQKRTLSQSHGSQIVTSPSFFNYKNHSIKLTIYTIAMVSASTILMGCQTNTKLSQSNQTSATTIDFSVVDSSRNQAQFQAFSSQLNVNAEQYQQLFDQSKHLNMETQAKTRLLSAIRQHLAGEHVAVSRANYHSVPYIKADSIDAGSSSFFRTLLELYAYKNTNSDNYDNYDNYDGYEGVAEATEEDSGIESETDGYSQEGLYADTVAVEVEESAATETILYDEFGYNENGYDRDGYDEYGNHQDGNIYSHDNNNNEYNDDYERENSTGNLASKIRGINVRGFLSEYENMQARKAQMALKMKTPRALILG